MVDLNNAIRVIESMWMIGADTHPVRIVLLNRPWAVEQMRPYSVNDYIAPVDAPAFYSHGLYDMSLEDATKYYSRRAANLWARHAVWEREASIKYNRAMTNPLSVARLGNVEANKIIPVLVAAAETRYFDRITV